MTSPDHELLETLERQYLASGYPGHKVWTFKPRSAEDGNAFEELYSRGYITPFGNGKVEWRLTDKGHSWILERNPMSDEAHGLLSSLRKHFEEKGSAQIRMVDFNFPGQERAMDELRDRGFIAPWGTGKKNWRLTEDGVSAVLGQ
jgi:hypothetical protein